MYIKIIQENDAIWNFLNVLKMLNSFILNSIPNKGTRVLEQAWEMSS